MNESIIDKIISPKISLFIVSSLLVVWVIHRVLTDLGDPFGLVFDGFLWLICSILKVLTIFSLFSVLSAVYLVVHKDRKKALFAFLLWSSVSIILTLSLGLTKEIWAPYLSNEGVKFYSINKTTEIVDSIIAHRDRWLQYWESGIVLWAELALCVVFAGISSLVGFFLGKLSKRAVTLNSILIFLVFSLYYFVTSWTIMDYDNFHGDIFSNSVIFDLIIFFSANDPYTSISVLYYFVFIFSSVYIIHCKYVLPNNGMKTD